MADEAREREIAARLAAATPGPWGWFESTCGCKFIQVDNGSEHGGTLITSIDDSVNDADAELIANAPADLAYLLEENQRLRKAAGRVVDNHEAVLAARPVDGSPLTIAHWNEIERLKVALGRPAEFDVDAAAAALKQIMLVRLGKANQERDKARADLAAARAEVERLRRREENAGK